MSTASPRMPPTPTHNGFPAPAFHQTKYCTEDTNHSWTGSHLEYDGGLNDGFVTQNDPDGGRAMGFYDESDLPYYYALAKTFAIGDRYFCSLLVGTFANRFYLLTGTSFGHIRNDIQRRRLPATLGLRPPGRKGHQLEGVLQRLRLRVALEDQEQEQHCKVPCILDGCGGGDIAAGGLRGSGHPWTDHYRNRRAPTSQHSARTAVRRHKSSKPSCRVRIGPRRCCS